MVDGVNRGVELFDTIRRISKQNKKARSFLTVYSYDYFFLKIFAYNKYQSFIIIVKVFCSNYY